MKKKQLSPKPLQRYTTIGHIRPRQKSKNIVAESPPGKQGLRGGCEGCEGPPASQGPFGRPPFLVSVWANTANNRCFCKVCMKIISIFVRAGLNYSLFL